MTQTVKFVTIFTHIQNLNTEKPNVGNVKKRDIWRIDVLFLSRKNRDRRNNEASQIEGKVNKVIIIWKIVKIVSRSGEPYTNEVQNEDHSLKKMGN